MSRFPSILPVSTDGRADARGQVVVSTATGRAVLAALAGLTPHPWQGVIDEGSGWTEADLPPARSLAAALEGVPETHEDIMQAAIETTGVRWSKRPFMRIDARFVQVGEWIDPRGVSPFGRSSAPCIVAGHYRREWNRIPEAGDDAGRFIASFGDGLELQANTLRCQSRYMSGEWDSGRYHYAMPVVVGSADALATAWARYCAEVEAVKQGEDAARRPNVSSLGNGRYEWRPLNGGERSIVLHFRAEGDVVLSWRSDVAVWRYVDSGTAAGLVGERVGTRGHRSRFIGRVVGWASPRSVAVAPMAGHTGPVRSI